MTLKRILFQFFRDQADSDKGHEEGSVEGGGEGVGQISVKIILTAFCMHLTLFNQVAS